MQNQIKEQINTYCSICHKAINIIKGRPTWCKNCKTNIAFIERNYQAPEQKLYNLKIRFLTLTIIKNNPKIGVSKALRQAINEFNLEK